MDFDPGEDIESVVGDSTLIDSFVIGGLVAIASIATRKGAEKSWKRLSKRPPPNTVNQDEVDIKDAVLWAVVVGAATGLVRLGVKRAISNKAKRLKK